MADTDLSLFGPQLNETNAVFAAGDTPEAPDRLSFIAPSQDPGALADEDFLLSVLGAALRRRVLRSSEGAPIAPVSVSCELTAPPAPGAPLTIQAQIDRRTRTIAFVSAEARANDGAVTATATGVFRIVA